MVVESEIPFYSLCSHHCLPFFGKATIAYIPKDRIVGLSKLPRILHWYSHSLQNQERLTWQVAKQIDDLLHPVGVGVFLTARHLCMEMRGACVPGTETTTSSLIGAMLTDPATREEFLSLARQRL